MFAYFPNKRQHNLKDLIVRTNRKICIKTEHKTAKPEPLGVVSTQSPAVGDHEDLVSCALSAPRTATGGRSAVSIQPWVSQGQRTSDPGYLGRVSSGRKTIQPLTNP